MSLPRSWPHGGLWRHRDFLRLWAAQIVSAWGSRITRTALPIIAVDVLHQPDDAVGLLGALQIAPGVVLALVAGGIVDRSHKRGILVGADLVRAALVASLTVAWWLGHLTMVHLVAVGAVAGAASALFQITDNTYLPSLVGKEHLAEGNAKLEATDAVAEIGGPAAAGFLIRILGAPLAVAFDAATYLWSALMLGTIRSREEPAARGEPHDVIADLRIGLGAVFGHPVLRSLILAQMVSYVSGGFFIALYAPLCLRVLELDAATFGVVISFGGVGALLGALVARRIPARLGLGPTLVAAALIAAAGMALIPLARGPLWLVLACLIAHQLVSDGAQVVFQIHAVTAVQTVLPPAILGRANAAVHVCTLGVMPLAALGAGALSAAIGTRAAVWIGVVGGMMAPLLLGPLFRLRSLATEIVAPARPE